MFDVDTRTEFGARVMERLEYEGIGWLITVDSKGTPQPSPVWFLWEDDSMIIYSQPDTAKLRNIERNPRVSVHLEGDSRGGDIVIFVGEARIDSSLSPSLESSAYNDKYRSRIMRINMTPESFSDTYSVPIRFVPEKVRGH